MGTPGGMVIGLTFAALALFTIVLSAAVWIIKTRSALATRWSLSAPARDHPDAEKAVLSQPGATSNLRDAFSRAKDSEHDVLEDIPAVRVTTASVKSISTPRFQLPVVLDKTRLAPNMVPPAPQQVNPEEPNGEVGEELEEEEELELEKPARVHFERVPVSGSDATGRWYFMY